MGRHILLGTFAALVLERDTAGTFATDPLVRRATIADLDHLGPLLAPDQDHRSRIEAGDICLWASTPEGKAAGVQWVNVALHEDRYLGKWSRCDSQTAYLNQAFVATEHRRGGLGRRLIIGAVKAASEEGRRLVRGAVLRENLKMARLLVDLGFEKTGTIHGLRVSRGFTLRLWKPSRQPPAGTAPASGGPRSRS